MLYVRHFALLITFIQNILLIKIFSFQRDPNGNWIIVYYEGFLKYANILAIVVLHGFSYYDHFLFSITGNLLVDRLYTIMTFTLLLISGIANTIHLIRSGKLVLTWYNSLETVHHISSKYNIIIDYQVSIVICCVLFSLIPIWILEFTFTRTTSWQLCLHSFLHATVFLVGMAQAIIPTLYFQLSLINGYPFFKKMTETIRNLEIRQFNIIETLNDMIIMNQSFVDILLIGNRIARFSLVGILLQTFTATLNLIVCTYVVGVYIAREGVVHSIFLNVICCVTIVFVYFVDTQQKQLAYAVIEIDNPTMDERINLLRKQFLQQLLHHKFDRTVYGMVTLYPSLLLVGIGTLGTMSMFVFQRYPELLL